MTNNSLFYIISIAVLFVLGVLVFIIVYRKRRFIRLKRQTVEFERQRNLIVSTPIMSELSKIEVIVKNDKLESKYKDWCERYETIKNEKFSHITDLLLQVDSLIEEKKYKEAKEAVVNLDMEIYKVRVTTDNLLDEIREITMSEERNRAIITKLKAKFRDLDRTLNANPENYKDMYKYIQLQFENIEKKFQDFEDAMEDNAYDDVVLLVKVLDEMIAHMTVVIEEMPDLILLTEKIIPDRINEVMDTYQKLEKQKYPLAYLKVEYNIDEIKKKISVITDKIKMLNLEDCMFELKTFLDYLDNLLNDFDVERRSKKVFDEVAKEFKNKITKVNKIVSDIYDQLNDIKSMYNLTNEDLEDLESVNKDLYNINQRYNEIIKKLKAKEEPYSVLKEEMEDLSHDFEKSFEELNSCLKSLGSMQDDEIRAREQLDEITELLKKCRFAIRSYKLPIISNNYFVELSEANEAIYEIVKELEKTPITIKTLNIRVDTARDLSLKLFNTTNEMIKTAKMAEMTIVYGNRYKVIDEDIEKGLDVASQLFFKGNYKKSLETAIAAINIVEPDIYNKMLNVYTNISENEE